jgi:tetratricopeptide (TPR) repeat protein
MAKQQICRIIIDILLSIAIIIVLCTVFAFNHNLENGIVSGKYFWFGISMFILAVFAIPAVIIRKEKLNFQLPDMLMLLFCCITIIISINHAGRFTNKCWLLGLLMMFYFYLKILLSNKSKLIHYLIVLFFMITGLVESVWGLRQLYGFIPAQHNLFKITGSFFNPGPYSGWLAMIFPMAFWNIILRINRKKIDFQKINIRNIFSFLPEWVMIIIAILTVSCILLILPAAMSRAAWLAALSGCAFIGILYGLRKEKFVEYCKLHRKRIIIFSFIAVILLVISMTGLFFLKKDSALGRAFIWKIAAKTIKEHPMGVGLGNFSGAYGDVQATYFASGAGTEQEEYVAEGVEYAFNEYLQICIETGIIPFLIFLAFVILTLFWGIRYENYLPAGSLIALLIFAVMSYPFNVLPFVIAFVFLSVLCLNKTKSVSSQIKPIHDKTITIVKWFFVIIAPIAITLYLYKLYPSYNAYKQCKLTQVLYVMNVHSEAAKEYTKQYPYLKDDITFLFKYAKSLSESGEYEKSNEILDKATKVSCDPMLYNIMGKNYQALQQYALAEQSLQKATNLVPNRLYPHYLLAKLYHEMGLTEKAKRETTIVMTKIPKVNSKAIEEMKNELRNKK